MFINDLLDEGIAETNFGFTGYQPPLTAFTPETLVENGYVPREPRPRAVVPRGLQTGVPLLQLPVLADAAVPPDLAGVQGGWLTGRPHRGTSYLWPLLALPGIVWVAVLFVAPLYVVLAILFGGVDPILRQPVPVWNPYPWDSAQFKYVMEHIVGPDAFFRPRWSAPSCTSASPACSACVIAYPVAYYTARFAGRWKGVLLAALIAPFWISYMMRMLAWVNLLQTEGLVNRALSLGGVFEVHVDWLGGRPETVVLGLVYGYVPYMILPLFAGPGPDAAGHAGGRARPRGQPWETFRRVTWPLSRQAVVASVLVDQPADAGRLLHHRPAVRLARHLDDRQPDQQHGADPGPDRPGGRVRAADPAGVDRADDHLRAARRPARHDQRHRVVSSPREPRWVARAQPVAQAAGADDDHLPLPGLVAAAGPGRRAVLLQRRPVAHELAGLLDALVLRRPAALGVERRQPAHAR